MKKKEWQELVELFEQIESKSQEEKDAFLARIRSEKPQLYERLASNFDMDASLDGFLENPAVNQLQEANQGTAEEKVSLPKDLQELPGLKIERVLGTGGMGEVWLAKDLKMSRQVALKVVRRGLDSDEARFRFRGEYRTLARMTHDHIARVYNVGETSSGRPYFTMEYFPGQPLSAFVTSPPLDLRQRLALFLQICEGIEHAHRQAIIHRDLKPSNLLVAAVEGRPYVKIIDFGIARSLEPDDPHSKDSTRPGMILGTPAYMSPEQVDGRMLDIGSDIYALGTILYELLTGTPPFDPERLRASSYSETVQILTTEEPPKPSKRLMANKFPDHPISAKSLVRELDWIVAKALEKDSSRRYDTVRAFMDDIQRFLGNRPVDAKPPTTFYKLTKLYQRRRVAVIAAAIVMFSFLFGSSAAFLGFIQAKKARAAAEANAGELDALFSIFNRVVDTNNPYRSQGVDLLSELNSSLYNFVSLSPRNQRKLYLTLGNLQLSRGKPDQAFLTFSEAHDVAESTWGKGDLRALNFRERMAATEMEKRRYDQAEKLYCDLFLTTPPDTDLAWRARLGLSDVLHQQGFLEEALEYSQGLTAGRPPDYLKDDVELYIAMRMHGMNLKENDFEGEGLSYLVSALENQTSLFGETHLFTLETSYIKTNIEWSKGFLSTRQALERFRYFEEELIQMNLPNHRIMESVLYNIGFYQKKLGRCGEALEPLARCVAIREQNLGKSHFSTLRARDLFAKCLRDSEAYESALKIQKENLDLLKNADADLLKVLRQRNSLANTLMKMGRLDEAHREIKSVIQTLAANAGSDHPKIWFFQGNLAEVLMAMDRHAEALPLLEACLEHDATYRGAYQKLYELCLEKLGK